MSFEWWWCFSSDVSQLVCLRRIYSLATLDQSGLLDSYVNKSFTIGLLWQVSPSWDGRGRVIQPQKDVISSLSNNQLLNSTFRPLPLTRWAQLADQSSYLTVLGENGHCCTEEEEQLWCWGRGDAAKEHPIAILEHFHRGEKIPIEPLAISQWGKDLGPIVPTYSRPPTGWQWSNINQPAPRRSLTFLFFLQIYF